MSHIRLAALNGRKPLFIVRDTDGGICNMFEPSACNRRAFRYVYGIARYEAACCGGTVQITCTKESR